MPGRVSYVESSNVLYKLLENTRTKNNLPVAIPLHFLHSLRRCLCTTYFAVYGCSFFSQRSPEGIQVKDVAEIFEVRAGEWLDREMVVMDAPPQYIPGASSPI